LTNRFLFQRRLAVPIEVPLYALADSIRQTVRDFRSECSEWEDEVRSLFNDIDRFLMMDGQPDSGPAVAAVAEDVAGLKGLVQQQTEVLAALVNALTGHSAAPEPASANDSAAPEFDPFERLQRAVAAASEAS
jgi:hypothetical protein